VAPKMTVIRPVPEVIEINGTSETRSLIALNDYFYEKRWTDGFPVMPPTREAVEWMLSGNKRDPDEVIGLVPPRSGKATVRNIAINAVLAGAEPAYLPVIIAAVEAVTDPQFAQGWGLAGMQATTGPVTPLLVINGPIAKELKIASGIDCFGRSHRANATIGRALRLVLINAGGAFPGVNDMKGQGSAQEFTFCVAEKEDHPAFRRSSNPWRPLHVEKGFPDSSSTVTAFAAFPPANVGDAYHCDSELINTLIGPITRSGLEPISVSSGCLVVLGSTHANCLAEAGMSKDDIRKLLYTSGVMPWSKYRLQYAGQKPAWMNYIKSESTPVHTFNSPDHFTVIVAGGDCPYSQVIKHSHTSVTKEIHK
jgi:hypothetical protein